MKDLPQVADHLAEETETAAQSTVHALIDSVRSTGQGAQDCSVLSTYLKNSHPATP